jgi:hypothetical protein
MQSYILFVVLGLFQSSTTAAPIGNWIQKITYLLTYAYKLQTLSTLAPL